MSLFYNYKSLNRYSQIHNYKDYVDGALENDEVNGTFLMNLYKSVEKFNFLYKEFNLNRDTKIKKLFKLDKVNA
jgi:oligoendopeptidase F